MKFRLNLVAIALASVSTGAMAFDFGVTAANDVNNRADSWKCKNCVSNSSVIGQVGVDLGALDSDDDYAANKLKYTDGLAAGVNSDLVINSRGYRTEIKADNLGSQQGNGSIKTGRLGSWGIKASFDEKNQYTADNAQSVWTSNNGHFVENDDLVTQSLSLQRKKYQLEANYTRDRYATYVKYATEDKTGKLLSSMSNGGIIATNLAAPVDMRTQNLSAGVNFNGNNWFSEVNYKGSWFDNNNHALSIDNDAYPSVSQAADNQAHFVSALGNYRFDKTYLSGRLVSGNMKQDSNFITLTGIPNSGNQGNVEVDILDANFKVSSLIAKGLRLNASVDYSDRDNTTDIHEYEQYNYNSMTGELVENRIYDTTRTTYKVSASYNLATGQRIEAGFDRTDTERSNQDREKTDDNIFWAQWRASNFEKWDLRLKGSYSDKGGSSFLYDDAVSGDESELMRKYYLADKKSSKAEVFVTHTPLDNVSVSFNGYYSLDDYTNTDIGLIESENYGYDLSVNWQVTETLNLNGNGGYQWIDNNQAGARNDYSNYWQANTNEQFGFIGVGFDYTGLADYGISIGGNYSYALSFSDSDIDNNDVFGDFESTSHYASVFVDYALSKAMTVGLRYEIERYKDSDDTQLPVNYYPGTGPTGIKTLGELNHDYTAHLVMATFRYHF
ncbi:MtrB/PioB family decaheme-associated outer membrane protein [Shewanella sp. 3_MG-2023]|uniref:MtrB/PioB family decaheme-associated outer membrane protein n=1 Tax=Shewanella sp. 3_MG-2023 TaxID=3062635 RepID=UPI0026E13A05|nr:MtrB/PioB family decaheme-associated outer membrane protein [Shewanella sp. 3_MG-2023]MDO6777205.1 MtrB/PioB family decaheme-associated outer membrane protein [Shewanella sp. 3_MG-2023]